MMLKDHMTSMIQMYHRKNSPLPPEIMFKKIESNFFPSSASLPKITSNKIVLTQCA